jgi:hypothetical protein
VSDDQSKALVSFDPSKTLVSIDQSKALVSFDQSKTLVSIDQSKALVSFDPSKTLVSINRSKALVSIELSTRPSVSSISFSKMADQAPLNLDEEYGLSFLRKLPGFNRNNVVNPMVAPGVLVDNEPPVEPFTPKISQLSDVKFLEEVLRVIHFKNMEKYTTQWEHRNKPEEGIPPSFWKISFDSVCSPKILGLFLPVGLVQIKDVQHVSPVAPDIHPKGTGVSSIVGNSRDVDMDPTFDLFIFSKSTVAKKGTEMFPLLPLGALECTGGGGQGLGPSISRKWPLIKPISPCLGKTWRICLYLRKRTPMGPDS